MSLDTPLDAIQPVIPTGQWLVSLREGLDSYAGTSLRYDGTIDGAWTMAVADLAGSVSEHLQLVIAASLLATAPPAVVVAKARDQGLDVREATYTTYDVTVAGTASPVTVPVGTLFAADSVATLTSASGEIQRINGAQFEVIENEAASEAVETGDVMVLRCITPGNVTFTADPITFRPVNSIEGFGTASWDSTQDSQIGQAEEPTWSLRQRIAARKAYRFGSPVGMVETIREIPWVQAVGLVESTGNFAIYVVPGPATADQETELAEAIYQTHPVGITAAGVVGLGDQSTTVTGADGTTTVTVQWYEGTTESVPVAFTLVYAAGANTTQVNQEARAAISQVFDALEPGETIRYHQVYSALNIRGVLGVTTLTLDGGTADVAPSNAANLLIPSFA